jgi:hypothetical protein
VWCLDDRGLVDLETANVGLTSVPITER